MAVLSEDMGGITAYAAAVNRGYTGTKEEFEQLMYSYTEVAERAEAAAGNAHESEEATIEAKDIAVSAKNEAVSARDASQSARDASVSAKNDSESARDSAISAKNDTLAAKDAVMSAKGSVDETSANFSDAVEAAISDVNAAGRNQKELAKTHAVDSEAWAVGQREGADVGVSDETYHNNSKYYAEQSALAKSETETARDTAITAKDGAVSAKNEAETAKGEAQDIVDGINAKSEQIDQNAEDIIALQTAMETKAEIDGYYEDMTVGDAEQLVSSKYVEDSEPYLYRTSGGSKDIGNREYVDAIVGGTVNWNQLANDFSGRTQTLGVTIDANNTDGTVRAYGTPTATNNLWFVNNRAMTAGHKYYFRGFPSNIIGASFGLALVNQGSFYDTGNGKIVNSSSPSYQMVVTFTEGVALDVTFKPQLFDLTAMFGSTIADYIYSLEQATAGAGVAFFRKLFPNDYYEYNVGELKSVEGVSAHNMVGFNQWDEEWATDLTIGGITGNIGSKNLIPVIPNAAYCFTTGSYRPSANGVRLEYFDANRNSIGGAVRWGGTYTMPENCHYIKFGIQQALYGMTYKNDICINLSWSGWRNGEYEPYVKHSYPLDSSLVLRGIPKLDANNNLYYDGDRYLSDGTVERRYAIVDLGTLSYSKTSSGLFYSVDIANAIKKSSDTSTATGSMMSAIYEEMGSSPISGPDGSNPSPNMRMAVASNGYVYFNNTAYTDAAAFKAAMSGVMLVYELATPTTESAEPYAEIQICDDFGTEEYVSTGIVPVGHETRYPANLRDKLQHLPDLADDDGYYMISQQNKNMSLELFRIPKAPTTDGVYTLKATVSGGTPTYTWEAEE